MTKKLERHNGNFNFTHERAALILCNCYMIYNAGILIQVTVQVTMIIIFDHLKREVIVSVFSLYWYLYLPCIMHFSIPFRFKWEKSEIWPMIFKWGIDETVLFNKMGSLTPLTYRETQRYIGMSWTMPYKITTWGITKTELTMLLLLCMTTNIHIISICILPSRHVIQVTASLKTRKEDLLTETAS